MPRTRDENEELIAELLADLEKYSGVPLEEIMASEFEVAAPEPEPEPLPEAPEQIGAELPSGFVSEPLGGPMEEAAHMAEPFSLENEAGEDFEDYLEAFYDTEDIDPDADDAYADEPV